MRTPSNARGTPGVPAGSGSRLRCQDPGVESLGDACVPQVVGPGHHHRGDLARQEGEFACLLSHSRVRGGHQHIAVLAPDEPTILRSAELLDVIQEQPYKRRRDRYDPHLALRTLLQAPPIVSLPRVGPRLARALGGVSASSIRPQPFSRSRNRGRTDPGPGRRRGRCLLLRRPGHRGTAPARTGSRRDDRPCGQSSGSISGGCGGFLRQGGRIFEENRLRTPVASLTRRSAAVPSPRPGRPVVGVADGPAAPVLGGFSGRQRHVGSR